MTHWGREQRHKLMQMLDAIVDALDRPALILAGVVALEQRDAVTGAVAEHYPIVEEALLYRTLAHPLCRFLAPFYWIGSAILAENGPCLETISRLRSSADRNHGVGSTIIWDTRHRNGWVCLGRAGALAGGGG